MKTHARTIRPRLSWTPRRLRCRALAGALLVAAVTAPLPASDEPRPLTFEELMQVRTIEGAVLSADGRFVAWTETPDRGDSEGLVSATAGNDPYRVARGEAPVFSSNGDWVAFRLAPSFAEQAAHEKTKGKEDEAPRPGLALLETATGQRVDWERVADFAFSDDGSAIAVHLFPDESEGEDAEDAGDEEAGDSDQAPERRKAGGELIVRRLGVEGAGDDETRIAWVDRYAWSRNRAGTSNPEGTSNQTATSNRPSRLAYAVDDPEGATNRLAVRTFDQNQNREQIVHDGEWAAYPALAWARERDRLAFLAGVEAKEDEVEVSDLMVWSTDLRDPLPVETDERAGEDWSLPAESKLAFDRSGDRLFFGYGVRREDDEGEEEAPEATGKDDENANDEAVDPYDREAILADRTVDVWHWNDPLIVPHQKKQWKQESERNYLAVAHLDGTDLGSTTPRVVRLADRELPDVETTEATWTIARSTLPYRKAVTWEGTFHDLYLVSTETGERLRLAERLDPSGPLSRSVSPSGEAVVFYRDGDWHLTGREMAAAGESPRNLTGGLGPSFADEDHDYPQPAPGYGIAGWVAQGEPGSARDLAVLLYDKYDLWRVPLDAGEPAVRLTAGREEERIFRLVDVERGHEDARGFHHPDDDLLYLAYHDRRKSDSFWSGTLEKPGARPLHEAERRFRFRGKAERADVLLYTEESYSTFPDLWTASSADLTGRRRASDANPDLAERDLGSAELVEWLSLDGEPLQGVLIKPPGYRPGQRVPVLVYFYRFFSQRLHEFNEPKVNHRPSFPVYATDGYAIFLPDIRFEVGRPGLASVKSLVPGVQKLIDLGVADPDAIGLHGHSWSGYQTAFIVTQTDLFKAAIAGAPVSNMTSAYSGIRWGSGMARQFQYEQSQSRIGGTLWDRLDLYIDNSPVFFADRINTPLLILHGDEDGAVPWYQSIELYLALRRLEKPAVFLQYRGEDHHPAKYANKLDWAIKMKEFFDHHLKGEPAPTWWSEGVPYAGK